jgi:hypothetical protein
MSRVTQFKKLGKEPEEGKSYMKGGERLCAYK